jgi:hypothetical protein
MGMTAALRVFKGAMGVGHTLKKARGWLAAVALLVLGVGGLPVVEDVVVQSLEFVEKSMPLFFHHHQLELHYLSL